MPVTVKPDLPYYRGQPVEISPPGWMIVVGSVVLAYAALVMLPFAGFPLVLVPPVLFTGLPLVALASVTGGRHTALFRRFGLAQAGQALGFGVLSILVSFVTAALLSQFMSFNANPAFDQLGGIGAFDVLVFLVRTSIQLIGEELLTILPLLTVLWLCVRRLNLSRGLGLAVAMIVSTLWFSAVHLPTYGWNLVQCFGIIGMPRLILTAAFLVTRNLWVCASAHIINDWTEFALPALLQGGHLPIEAGG